MTPRFGTLDGKTQGLLRRKAVVVRPVCAQGGRERFPTREGDERPTMKEWRLNLARLSHSFNLLFVAVSEKIFVYEPDRVNQRLAGKPSLILSPRSSGSATSGYIDPENPGSINHLYVEFLGTREVVLIARDDGDVYGYYSHDIQAAIDTKSEDVRASAVEASIVKPFFAFNVGNSAWGLAIHTNARKIAISANSRAVTVITLGLRRPDPKSPSGSDKESQEPERNADENFVFSGFPHNLPCVAFCNTDADKDGRWLVAGVITGLTYLHDLLAQDNVDIMEVGFCLRDEDVCGCPNQRSFPHAPWLLHWIDRRAFKKVSGYLPDWFEKEPHRYRYWDGSAFSYVPDGSREWRSRAADDRLAMTSLLDVIGDEISDEDMDLVSDEAEIFELALGLDAERILAPEDRPANTRTIRPWDGTTQPSKGSRGYFCNSHPSGRSPLPEPLFIANTEDCTLFQPDLAPLAAASPQISYDAPLFQKFILPDGTPARSALSIFDRISLSAVIPELGVIVVGSPVGRVAVFSLLRTEERFANLDTVYFHRPDWFLPLESQERAGQRPHARLVGLAAGPVAGELGKHSLETKRRWRLLLYYEDHSVLGYEIFAAH